MSRLNQPVIKTFEDVFRGSSEVVTLEIPKFQRPYVWGAKSEIDQVENFWTDFIETSEASNTHMKFVGTVILCETSVRGKYLVVDGQQRMITASLFIAAIKKVWYENFSEDETYHDISKLLFASDAIRRVDDQPRIKMPTRFEPIYVRLLKTGTPPPKIQVKSDTEKNMINTYERFKEMVSSVISENAAYAESKNLQELLRTFLMRLLDIEFIQIGLKDEEDAYFVFESFNAKGVELAVADLLKNLILSKIDGTEAEINQAVKKWEEIEENAKLVGLPKFNTTTLVRYYWLSKHAFVSEKQLYGQIKKKTTDYKKLLKEIHQVSVSLAIILSGDYLAISELIGTQNHDDQRRIKHIAESLEALKIIKVQNHLIWLIALIQTDQIKKINWLRQNMSDIENFAFRYFALGKQPANKLEKIFSKISIKLHKDQGASRELQANVLTDFRNNVRDLLPTDEDLRTAFQELKLKSTNKALIKYIFRKLEKSYRKTNEVELSMADINIEHILPQKPAKWGLTQTEVRDYVDMIGNLTILDRKLNSSTGNGTLKNKITDKEAGLRLSEIKLNTQLVQAAEKTNYTWNREVIAERQQQFADEALVVWKLS
jgi:uncharacterized protein with ParB-like and HNH nuclease domain